MARQPQPQPPAQSHPQPQAPPAPQAQPAPHSPQVQATVSVSPLFRWGLIINIALCVGCLGIMTWLSYLSGQPGTPTKMQESLFATCETVFKMTAGAFLGLVAGRGAAPDKVQASP